MTHTPDENYQQIQVAVQKIYELEKELALLKVQLGLVRRDNEFVTTGIGRVLWLVGGGFITAITLWITNGGLNEK